MLDGYWVYLESPPTESGERRLLERLTPRRHHRCAGRGRAGFAPHLARRVLGRDARRSRSPRSVARLQLLPQIEAREKAGTAIWLDLTLKSDAPPLEGQKFPAGDAELEFRPCPVRSGAPAAAESGRGIAPPARRAPKIPHLSKGRLSSVGRAPDL